MLNFCTLYNSNYAAKGLALYWSLKRVCPEFRLFVFAFDDILAEALEKMALPEVTVVTLKEFEDEELLRVKPTRTAVEYCWTCTASTILYCLNNFDIDHCTYLDADLCFFQNPQIMIDEMGDNDIQITPHWFSKECDSTDTSGKYCVQFVVAKNTPNAKKVISDWRNDCLEWCFDGYEDGKQGDQMYLMKWQDNYPGIFESRNMGGGVAPWNMQRYDFMLENDELYVREKELDAKFPVVFFHFHCLVTKKKWFVYESIYDSYPITDNCIKTVYYPYLKELIKAYKVMKHVDDRINGLAVKKDETPLLRYIREIVHRYRHSNIKHKFWI